MAEERLCYVSEAGGVTGGVTKDKNLMYILSSTQDVLPANYDRYYTTQLCTNH